MKRTILWSIAFALAAYAPAGAQETPKPFLIVTVETEGHNLSPVYRQPTRNQSETPTIEACRAVNHVRVCADDLDRVGGLIDAAITAGANRIAGLTFEARDPEPSRLEAMRAAVARSEAKTVAEALGVDLRMPLEVQTSADLGVPPRMPMYRTMELAQTAAPTPDEQVVRANVTIRYQLLTR